MRAGGLRRRIQPAAIAVRIEHADDAGDARLGGPAARVAGQRDRAGGGAVVRAVARDDLLAAGDPARDLDGVLVGLGAAVGEEGLGQVAGGDLRQHAAQLGADAGGGRGWRDVADLSASAP